MEKIVKAKNFIVDQAIRSRIITGQQEYQRFVIVSTHRSGSTYLMNLAKSHPNSVVYSEAFLPRKIIWGTKVYRTRLQMQKQLGKRNTAPVRFLEEDIFRDYASYVKAVGFKIHYDQLDHFDKLRIHLKEDMGLKTIHLKRLNQLDRLISYRLAQKTGVMNVHKKSKSKEGQKSFIQLALTVEECQQFFEESAAKMEGYSQFLAQDSLIVTYDDLVNSTEQTLKRIQVYLGLSYYPLTSFLVKQNKVSQSERIINYEELFGYFKDTKWGVFFKG